MGPMRAPQAIASGVIGGRSRAQHCCVSARHILAEVRTDAVAVSLVTDPRKRPEPATGTEPLRETDKRLLRSRDGRPVGLPARALSRLWDAAAMRVMGVCLASPGHANPLVPLVSELVAQGCDVLIASGAAVRPIFEPTGAAFVLPGRLRYAGWWPRAFGAAVFGFGALRIGLAAAAVR